MLRKITIARLLIIALLLMFPALALLSCSSTPTLEDESPSLYFKAAEMARFQRKRQRAIGLYQLIQLRFADNFPILLEAEFSIAQIYFSWNGHDEEAKTHYENVVQFYQRPEIGTDTFPLGYLNLALQNLQTIARRRGFSFLPPKTDGVHTLHKTKEDKPATEQAEATKQINASADTPAAE